MHDTQIFTPSVWRSLATTLGATEFSMSRPHNNNSCSVWVGGVRINFDSTDRMHSRVRTLFEQQQLGSSQPLKASGVRSAEVAECAVGWFREETKVTTKVVMGCAASQHQLPDAPPPAADVRLPSVGLPPESQAQIQVPVRCAPLTIEL